MMENNIKEISIVIPIYVSDGNLFNITRKCLEHIKFDTANVKTEIIVVDDCSPKQNLVDILKNKFPEIKLLHNDKNLGFAHSINKGIANASKDLILLLNNDIVITKRDWLYHMINTIELNNWDLVAPEYGELDSNNEYLSKIKRELYDGVRFQYLAGWCLLIKRKVFEQIGLLPTSFGRGYWEDTLYSRIIKEQSKFKMGIANGVGIIHLEHTTFKAVGLPINDLYNKNREIYINIIKGKSKYILPKIEDYK